MSSKVTIAYGDNFHLYEEMEDRDNIYLKLKTTHYLMEYGEITMPIPIHIWEVIRGFSRTRLDLAGLSDLQLRQKVEHEVDERIQKWRIVKDKKKKSFYDLCWSYTYGWASEPRAKQIQKGLKYYREQRKWQRKVKAAIEKLRWENSPEGMKHRQEEHNRCAERFQAAFKAAEKRRKKKSKKRLTP